MTQEQPPKPKKRLVTKGQYVLHLGKTVSLTGVSVVCFSIGILSALLALFEVLVLLAYLKDTGGSWWSGVSASMYISFALSGGLLWAGVVALRKVRTAEEVAPITRHNTDKLPPEESLVRAASEPTMPQEDVLLRAATGIVETDPQQLLRASASQDSPSE